MFERSIYGTIHIRRPHGGGGGQKNSPQIADTWTFKTRNWAKVADGGGGGPILSDFMQTS